jgi:L-fuculose-phosphate aldolase
MARGNLATSPGRRPSPSPRITITCKWIEDVCVLDFKLKPLAGERQPSVESAMHAAVYRVRGCERRHPHPPGVRQRPDADQGAIPALFDEQARFLGRSVEIIPHALASGMLKNAIAKHVKNSHNAYLMQNHGADPGRGYAGAVHNVEILEKCALAYLLALCAERPVSKIPLAVRRSLCQAALTRRGWGMWVDSR